MDKNVTECYSRQIYLHSLENIYEVMNVKVNVKLTNMKPLHSKWLSEFYNYINSSNGQEITNNGWLRAGITDAIKIWSSSFWLFDFVVFPFDV